MGNDRTELQGPFALDPADEAGWRAIAEMSQKLNDCGFIASRSPERLTASDEDGWRNIARAWEEREVEDVAVELAALRALVQEVLDQWHSDSWALSPFAGVREWQKKAIETLNPKAGTVLPSTVVSLHAGADMRFVDVTDDAPVWL